MSEKGWQLIKGGLFSNYYKKNEDIRYRYQLDFNTKIEDMGRRRNAHAHENLHEGAGLHADFLPGPKCHKNRHRAHIEDENTPDNLIDGRRDGLVGIFRFAGGDTDKLNATEGEHDHRNGQSQAPYTIGQKAAIGPKIAEVVGEGLRTAQQNIYAEHNHQHDGGNRADDRHCVQLVGKPPRGREHEHSL